MQRLSQREGRSSFPAISHTLVLRNLIRQQQAYTGTCCSQHIQLEHAIILDVKVCVKLRHAKLVQKAGRENLAGALSDADNSMTTAGQHLFQVCQQALRAMKCERDFWYEACIHHTCPQQ